MMNSKTNVIGIDSVLDLTKAAAVAALYIVLTMVFAAVSYGPVQFRFSEGLNNLVPFNKRYIIAITVACFITNITSPNGAIDMVVGTFETLINLVTIYLVTKRMKSVAAKMVASVLIGTFYMFIIGFEIAFIAPGAFWPTFWSTWLTAGIGEFVTMTIGAIVLYMINMRVDLSK